MKTLLSTLLLTFALLANADAQYYVNGHKVQLTAPQGITKDANYMFPTFDYQSLKSRDSIKVSLNQLETYVYIDTVKADSANVIYLTRKPGILPGAKLYVQTGKYTAPTTLRISQGGSITDTITVDAYNLSTAFVYNGTRYAATNGLSNNSTRALDCAKIANCAWSLTGNAGTDPANNFIGTTDSVSFNIGMPYLNNYIAFVTAHGGGIDMKTPGFDIQNNTADPFFSVSTTDSITTVFGYLKYQDANNTYGTGKVLTSDTNGLASWQQPGLKAIKDTVAVLSNSAITLTKNKNNVIVASGSLTGTTTYTFPTGVDGDKLYISNTRNVATPAVTGTGTATITADKIADTAGTIPVLFVNIGGNWY